MSLSADIQSKLDALKLAEGEAALIKAFIAKGSASRFTISVEVSDPKLRSEIERIVLSLCNVDAILSTISARLDQNVKHRERDLTSFAVGQAVDANLRDAAE